MKYLLIYVALLGFSGLTSAAPKGSALKIKEDIIQPPRGWVQRQPAPPGSTINLRIALSQPNFSRLEEYLYEVSDPFHERYGDHLSKEDVEELVSPHPESVERVDSWLASHGIQPGDVIRSPANDWITISIPISLAETMLDTKYHVWENTKDSTTVVRTTSYSLPEDLHSHVDLVQPTTLFSSLRGMSSTFRLSLESPPAEANDTLPIKVPSASGGQVDASCNHAITLSCLQQLYNAVGYEPSAKHKNTIAVTSYLDQFASFSDLQKFYHLQRREAEGSNFTVVSINGGQNNQSTPGGEANLDTQFAFGLAFPTPATFFTTGGSPPFVPDLKTPINTNEPYLEWLDFILSHPNPPLTISTSYSDDEQTIPKSYAKRVCNGFAQLGARGVTLLFSSGDGGVGDGNPDPTTQSCFANDGKNRTEFLPQFPPSCPFVTSVGGTIDIPETGVFFSGGGFSNLFERPSYQDKAVPRYLKKLPKNTYKGLFNPKGRGVPDVSAQSDKFQVIFEGANLAAAGTSASAPTFAGIVSLLNDARLSKGLPPLGFLNPLLYSVGIEGLNDITIGSNPGCGTPGFNATKGWDPVTGLGTPNFGKLKDIVERC